MLASLILKNGQFAEHLVPQHETIARDVARMVRAPSIHGVGVGIFSVNVFRLCHERIIGCQDFHSCIPEPFNYYSIMVFAITRVEDCFRFDYYKTRFPEAYSYLLFGRIGSRPNLLGVGVS